MSDSSASAAKPRPDPLFRLELKSDGGVLAPRSVEELRDWVQREFEFWSWADNVPGINRGPIDQGISYLRSAREYANRAISEKGAGGDPRQTIEEARKGIEQAYIRHALPHSSSTVAKEVERMRLASPESAIGFLFPQMQEVGQHRFDSNSAAGWYGFVLGLFRTYGEPSGLRQLEGQRESFAEFLAESKRLLAERRDELDRVENDVASALQRTSDDADTRAKDYAQFMDDAKREHSELIQSHKDAMSVLQRTYSEDMALRAPVTFWAKRQTRHAFRSGVLGVVLLLALIALGIGVYHGAAWATAGSLDPLKPDSWRLVVVGAVGVLGIWAIRIIVRMFLSDLHLSTDAAERVTMVQTYLSLMQEDKLPKDEERKLVLQALFRPATDGVVKEESLPSPFLEYFTKPGSR